MKTAFKVHEYRIICSPRRLACILRNPPEDDDEEQIKNTTQPTAGAIEAPPVEQTSQFNHERY